MKAFLCQNHPVYDNFLKGCQIVWKQQLETIRQLALKAIEEAEDQQGLENLRVKYLWKKGELTAILKQMGKLSPEERPIMGQLANDVRAAIEETFTKKSSAFKKKHCWSKD